MLFKTGLALLLTSGCLSGLPESRRLAHERLESLNPPVQVTANKDRYGSHYPQTHSGHNWITKKAFELLRNTGYLPEPFQGKPELENLVQYGVSFADEPWLGRPEDPYGIVFNHMTWRTWKHTQCDKTVSYFPNPVTLCHTDTYALPKKWSLFQGLSLNWTTGFTWDSAKINDHLDVKAKVRTYWAAGWEGHRMANVAPYIKWELDLNEKSVEGLPVTALDNMFHFTYSDLRFISEETNPDPGPRLRPGVDGPSRYDLRLKFTVDDLIDPFRESIPGGVHGTVDHYLQYVPPLAGIGHIAVELWRLAGFHESMARSFAQDLVAKLGDDRLVVGPPFGSITYGAILLQLSRKFFPGSRAEPTLRDLVPQMVPGRISGDPPLTRLKLDFPATYLGGMPFICARPTAGPARQEYSEANPCKVGLATWPIWVPPMYSADRRDEFLAALLRPRPGRSDRVAAIYLGWAAHMLQDGALPWHTANWQGYEHERQERFDANGYIETETGYERISIADMQRVVMCNDEAATIRKPLVQTTVQGSNAWVVECRNHSLMTMDGYLMHEVNRRFKNRSRVEICKDEGFSDEQIKDDRLNYEAVRGFFVKAAERSYRARFHPPPHGLARVRDAVVSTMVLLMCAPPLSPVSAPTCRDGDRRCDGDQALLCTSGGEVKVEDCIANEPSHCRGGLCVPDHCPSDFRCEGNTAYKCLAGDWSPSQFCSSDGRVCIDGVCQPGPCRSKFRCVGDNAEQCHEGRWYHSYICNDRNWRCHNGECTNPESLCESGYKCVNGVAKKCVGGAWQDSDTCSADGKRCLGNACRVVCESGSLFCERTGRCYPNGTGPCVPNCGPGELLCSRTNTCYPKWQKCHQCESDRDCVPTKQCVNNSCEPRL